MVKRTLQVEIKRFDRELKFKRPFDTCAWGSKIRTGEAKLTRFLFGLYRSSAVPLFTGAAICAES